MWLHTQFSNTSIVHQLKQRRHDCEGGLDTQTFMTLFPNLLQVLSFDEEIYETLETVFHQLPKHPEIHWKILHCASTTLFLVFGYPDETQSLVFNILHIEFLCSLGINDSKSSSHKEKIPLVWLIKQEKRVISVSQGETMKKCGVQYLIIVQDIVYLES